MIHVSAGIIRNRLGEILICQRNRLKQNGGLWEFPGGKQEEDEDAAACLLRELNEELHMTASDAAVYAENEHQGIHFTFITVRSDDEPALTEHEDCRWVHAKALPRYAWCPADAEIAQRLAEEAPAVSCFLWDFDGTLLDTYPMVVKSFMEACRLLHIDADPVLALDLMKDTLSVCMNHYAAEAQLPAETVWAAFREQEDRMHQQPQPPLPGIPEALQRISAKGGRHFIATNRNGAALEMLEAAGLLPYFEGWVTAENGFPSKPAPDSILYLLERYGLEAEKCVMIGDRPLDIESGRNAGTLTCLIDPEHRFPDLPCDFRTGDAHELPDLLMP